MRLALLKEIPEDENLQRQWNSLVMGAEQPQVFYTYEWTLAVYRAYGEKLRPLLFLGYEENRLAGVAALACDAASGQVSFLCATTGDYCDFICADEARPAFVSEVLDALRRRGFESVTLTNLPADSATVTALRQASGTNGYHLFARTAYQCAQVSLQPFQVKGPHSKATLPGNKKLRRSLHTLGKSAIVRFDHLRSRAELEPALPQFIQAHVGRFLLTGQISNLARRERCTFLGELMKLLSAAGWLTVTRMLAGERTIAWNYGFQFAGSWFWYQPTFDSEFEKYSPGTCLLAKIIEEACRTPGITIVDLGLGAEGYKEAFGNRSRETLYITLRASVGKHASEMLRYGAASAVKASPKLEMVVRSVVERWQSQKEVVRRQGAVRSSRRLAGRFFSLMWSTSEVIFFESCNDRFHLSGGRRLVRLDLNQVASAVSEYVDDRQTCEYLLRCAGRLRTAGTEGLALVGPDLKFLHFLWCAPFQDFFLSELNAKVDAPSADSVMLFDCWTPESVRGHGYYGEAVMLTGRLLRERGKRPWIFTASTNSASIRGLQKTGFERRHSLVRQLRLGWQRIRRESAGLGSAPAQIDTTLISADRGSHIA